MYYDNKETNRCKNESEQNVSLFVGVDAAENPREVVLVAVFDAVRCHAMEAGNGFPRCASMKAHKKTNTCEWFGPSQTI